MGDRPVILLGDSRVVLLADRESYLWGIDKRYVIVYNIGKAEGYKQTKEKGQMVTIGFQKRGRQPKLYKLSTGEMAMVKRMFKIGNGYAILLPTEWLALLDSRGELQKADGKFTIYVDESKLIIEPLRAEIEGQV